MKIAIDPGHGIDTPGKRTPAFEDGSVMLENEFNEGVAYYLHEALLRNELTPYNVAEEQTDIPLRIRTDRANNAKVDLYVSIHANAYGTTWNKAHGLETYVYSMADTETVNIAQKVQEALVRATGLTDRGVKAKDLHVLRESKMPAILVECGFMTNRVEAELLKKDSYRKLCAEAICEGICYAFGYNYKNSDTEKVKIIVDGVEHRVTGIKVEEPSGATNYVKIRDIAPLLGYEVSSKGSVPVLTKK